MSNRARPPELPEADLPQKLIAPPSLPGETAALPMVVESSRLQVQPRKFANQRSGVSHDRQRSSRAALTTALGASFFAGLLFAGGLYATGLIPGTAKATAIAEPQGLVWPALLAPGALSPRGQSSVGVTPDQAFQIADAKLHGSEAPDQEEARYWLRVGIAGALSSDRLRWALTQLGTLYARPAASPLELAATRSVWELAAAQRDPVALCFLARLEDGQSGTQQNRAVALELFQQAKATGICSGADQAIERLSR